MAKKRVRRDVTIATVALVLGNLANILESSKKLSSASYDLIVYAWHGARVLPVALTTIGYLAIAMLIFRVLAARVRSKPVAAVGAAIPATMLLATNLIAIPPQRTPLSVWEPELNRISNRIVSASTGKGLRWTPDDPRADVQVWSTAQGVVGLLKGVSVSPEHDTTIRAALTAMETARISDGWGYWPDFDWSVTEINGWATLAYIYSLERPIWTDKERSEIVARIDRDLIAVISRQQPDGGWKPITDNVSGDLARTYSTVISLWALAEAKNVPALASSRNYDRDISEGVSWLLRHYRSPSGWIPNPSRGDFREVFPGLTAQVLFVLDRISDTSPRLINSPTAHNAAKEEFVTHLTLPMCTPQLNTRVPDTDVHMRPTQRVLEGTTFLWFPWSLATVANLASDPAISEQAREKAADFRDQLLARHPEVVANMDKALTYELAENLLGISHALRALATDTMRIP